MARFQILEADSAGALTPVSGFLREAGFTHSLTPARNCTFACSYCYVPTMRVFGGLRREDWEDWGGRTTFKSNAGALLRRSLRPDQRIYCSPLVDPYQPAEETRALMPEILDAAIARPPRIFVIQTRGPLILRDTGRLLELASVTRLRISFSLTTNREEIRRFYEPHCAGTSERLRVMRELRAAGLDVWAALAPLLPCDPEELAGAAAEATGNDLIGDPLHVRAAKPAGATTREEAFRIAAVRSHEAWFEPRFQQDIVRRIARAAGLHGRRFATGPEGFGWLARN